MFSSNHVLVIQCDFIYFYHWIQVTTVIAIYNKTWTNNIKLDIEHTTNDVNISLINPNIDNIETTPDDVNISLITLNIDNISLIIPSIDNIETDLFLILEP